MSKFSFFIYKLFNKRELDKIVDLAIKQNEISSKKAVEELKKQGFKIGMLPPYKFEVTWYDAINPPIESGRYWCLIREQNDLGLSFHQWNVEYNFEDREFKKQGVIFWTYLLPNPHCL